MTLGKYLKTPRPQWDWQKLDCCRWVDGWLQVCGYESPFAAMGFTYDSERSALLTIRRGGGLVSLWSRGMALAGIPEGDDARIGDVGVIERATVCGVNETVGIFTGERWASISENAMHSGPADVLKLWHP